MSIMVPEAPLGMPGRNIREGGRANSSMLPACFPFQAGHCLQSNSRLCAPFLTQGQGLGGPEPPHTCLLIPPYPSRLPSTSHLGLLDLV